MELDQIVNVRCKVYGIRKVRFLGAKEPVTYIELRPVDKDGNPDLNKVFELDEKGMS